MAEHFIPRVSLHEDLLRLYREGEEVGFLDPIPDDRDRVRVITKPRGGETRGALRKLRDGTPGPWVPGDAP